MSEKAPQIQADEFIADMAVKYDVLENGQIPLGGNNVGEGSIARVKGSSGSVVEDLSASTTSSTEGSSRIGYRRTIRGGDYTPDGAGHASTSHTIGDTWNSYKGDIAPQDFGIKPEASRQGVDPTTGETVRYRHKFKDERKAGQLIAKLAAKRIDTALSSERESGAADRKAA